MTMHPTLLRFLLVGSLLFPISQSGAQPNAAPQHTVNGVFNGNFEDGITGWSKLGPGHANATFDSERHATANRVDSEFFIRSPKSNRETFTAYTFPVGVTTGKVYPLKIRVRGKGRLHFGVMEYDEKGNHIANRYSDEIQAPELFSDFEFNYKPSFAAKTVRPAIAILAREESDPDLDVVVNSFNLEMPDQEFATATKEWPRGYDDGTLRNHPGLTEKEKDAIRLIQEDKSIVPPYRPIEDLTGGKFRLTVSAINFGRSPLPEGISLFAQEILAAPLRLRIRHNGKEETIDWTAPKFHSSPSEVSFSSEASQGPLRLKMEGRLEYDAMLFITLHLESSAPVDLEGLSLVLELNPEAAKYIRYVQSSGGSGETYEFGYGPIPEFGQEVITKHATGLGKKKNHWNPKTPAVPGNVIFDWKQGRFDMLMLCNEDAGLGFVCESSKGWSFSPGDTQFQIRRTGKSVEAEIHFITKPVTLDGKRILEFAIQAMPPKPIARNFAKMYFNRFWDANLTANEEVIKIIQKQLQEPKTAMDSPPSGPALYASVTDWFEGVHARPLAQNLPSPQPPDRGFIWWDIWATGCGGGGVAKPEALNSHVRMGREVNHLGLPYFAATHLSPLDPNAYYYAVKNDEWAIRPRIPSSYTLKVDVDSLASAYQAWSIGKMIDEHDIPGAYFDNCSPELNLNNDAGYIDDEGILQPKLGIYGIRNLFRMTRREFAKRGKEPFIFFHAGLYPGICSFADAYLDGEGTYGMDHTEMITPGEFRARWTNPNATGVVTVYQPQFGYGVDREVVPWLEQERRGARPLLAQALIHGTQVFGIYMDRDPLYRTWSVFNGLEGSEVGFLPYWQWKINDAFSDSRLFFSLYFSGSKAILVAANHGSEEKAVSLPLALFPPEYRNLKRAQDEMDGQKVDLTSEEIKVVLPPKDFRLLTLEK